MIDFHTHILPNLDDGASNVEMSSEMLKIELEQGVNTVIATPHYSFDNVAIDDFLYMRNNAFEMLNRYIIEKNITTPNILLGAEVRITPHISKREGLEKLCIGSTKLILLEMPYHNWFENWVFDEIFSIIVSNKLIPVIAHVDRYIEKKKDFEKLSKLFRMGVKIQINIDRYSDRHHKKNIDKLIKEGHAHIVGSDCHNIDTRPPLLNEKLQLIEKKHGEDVVKLFKANASKLINTQ